ncbi:hypothetical protein MLD38_005568 [Melastoma candidum]|uniref:Uncharacterized protein n=1 Tax=Melastoma candidum TaxID=119954 RepID=A0ACB9RJU3_9MYRT|nr:hypothetical protein MLD38_005568 [Melastoma candidum]
MAESSFTHLPSLLSSFFLLLLSIITTHDGGVHGSEERQVLHLQSFLWEQKNTIPSCLTPLKPRQQDGATILEMVLQDRCTGRSTMNWSEKQKQRLVSDEARLKSLQSRIRSTESGKKIVDVSQAEIPLKSGIKLQTLNYIVEIQLGGENTSVIVDTGSDLTWVQCQPCRICYNQKDPLFNPSVSPSYRTVLCNSSTCQTLESAMGNTGACGFGPPTCNYVVSYGDGSYTRGELGTEHLQLGAASVDNFVFGCGRNNKGLFGGASGIMGLGRSSLSLVSQTTNIFNGVFSYCLPSAESAASGSLVFGADSSAYKNLTPVTYTTMISRPQLPTFYFINITGITVGGAGIQSPSFGKAGILIDSGTVISRLPPSMYSALKSEFFNKFSGYPPAPGFSILDTCFNLSNYTEVEIPTIRLKFEGYSEIPVDVTGVFYFAKPDASQVCLALASLTYEDDIGIIGNYQQKNQRVIYDTKASKLGFARETCSFL